MGWLKRLAHSLTNKEKVMFLNHLYPHYRGYGYGYGYGYPSWNYAGYNNWSGYSSNIIGSAIANQNMNVIGTGAIGGSQIATPTAIW